MGNSVHTIRSQHQEVALSGPTAISVLPGPVSVLLLLLSIAVLTVCLDRIRWWTRWWRSRSVRHRQWQQDIDRREPSLADRLEDWDLAMAFGEPLLRAAAVLAPLLGLVGTVFALMQVLARLGPDLILPAGTSLQGYGQVLMSTGLGLLISLVASAGLEVNRGMRHWQISRLERQWRRQVRALP
jgi:biopolymer transport protein ExbB